LFARETPAINIHLTDDLVQIVHDAVGTGLYAGEDDVIRDALTRLKQSMPPASKMPARKTRGNRMVEARRQPVTPDELNRRLLDSGLVIQLPDPSKDVDDAEDLPIEIQGEPLSETIIRERG
jgi:Arc/MetJ-type ribon-helix-helix transcriptional regulator